MRFATRFVGAMRLDPAAYEDVEADVDALPQAFGIVVAFAVAAGIGLAGPGTAPRSLVIAVAAALAGWLSWASLVCYLGVRVFPERQTRADVGQLARTVGFSAAPGIFFVLLAVPVPGAITSVVGVALSLWMAAAMVLAVRQALDFTHVVRAIAVCAAGWLLIALIVLGFGFAFGVRLS